MPILKTAAVHAAAWALSLLACGYVLAHDVSERQLLAQSDHPGSVDAAETLTGIVSDFVVDDPARGSSHRFVELQQDDGTMVSLRGGAADALTKGARVQVSGRRIGKPLEVEHARTLTPAGATPVNKASTDVEGTLAILHADYFAEGTSRFVYEIHEAAGAIREMRLGSMPSELEPGMRLRVVGRAESEGAAMIPDRITILARPPATTSAAAETVAKAATVNTVLVIMANFNNTAAPALTSTQAQQVMTTNSDSVANFFRETSYGQQLTNVTVTPNWVTMNMAKPASCNTSDWQGIGNAASTAAKAYSTLYDPAAYNFVVYVFPSVPSCGWYGLAYIGSPHKSWINGVAAFNTGTIGHEMGHNFGLLHAASLRCSAGAIGGSCSVTEYGDPFDTMGNQRTMHYNAMQKSKLAWIPSTSVKTHAGGSATYTLSPLEVAGASTYAVKIPTTLSKRTYWIEFRQPIGFDSPLAAFPNNGAEIRVAAPFETLCAGCDTYSDDTQLLDMTTGTSAFTDATLAPGQTYNDPTYGINVTVLSATSSALTIQVATGGALTTIPSSTALSATPNPSTSGGSVTFAATVSGNAPTGTVSFAGDGSALAGCSAVSLTGSGNARTASCATSTLAVGTHAIVASYAGDAGNSASASSPLTQVVNAVFASVNVALAANGGVASASSTNGPGFPASALIDNQRTGANWGAGGGWNDATAGVFPDWVQINFSGVRTIDRAVVYSVQDNYLAPVEPTDTTTFSLRGITDFQVQGYNGTSWVTLATVAGNNLVKRSVTFTPFPTDRLRINVTHALASWTRITEIEAWGQ
jgi:hypothetical protein